MNNTEYLLYIDRQNVGAMILNGVAVLLCMVCIFQFKNRPMQKRLIMINMVLIVATAVLSVLNASLFPGGISGASLHMGSALFVLALLFCMLAIRGIRKDEQLLRSADRLR